MNIYGLFYYAKMNPKNPMNQPGRLMGRHCKARLQRAVDKRVKKGKRLFGAAWKPFNIKGN
jgi:uncharacterized protein YlaI